MKIAAVAEATGVSQRMIRHYEAIGLIPRPSRLDSNYRDYSSADVGRLRFVANARDLGFPTDEIAELLALWGNDRRASAEVKKLALARAEALDAKARKLDAMRATLLDLASRCSGSTRPDCPIIDELSANQDVARLLNSRIERP